MRTLKSKLPFKALTYREALIHRFYDQASGAAYSASAGWAVFYNHATARPFMQLLNAHHR